MTIFPQNNQDPDRQETDLMDIQHRDYHRDGQPNFMSHLALLCGIVALIGIFFNLSLPLGALTVIFALLSRDKKLSREAKHGLAMGLTGIAVTAITILVSVAVLVSSGLFGKYVKKIRNIDPSNPNAVAQIQNDLVKDLEKYYGLDSSSENGTTGGDSPIDPVIGSSRRERRDANQRARGNSEADSISEASGSDSASSSVPGSTDSSSGSSESDSASESQKSESKSTSSEGSNIPGSNEGKGDTGEWI